MMTTITRIFTVIHVMLTSLPDILHLYIRDEIAITMTTF